jgi:hypothetical protein
MPVLDEILAWSVQLGDSWVRDALRRIVTQASIADEDVEDLAGLCKKPHGLTDGPADIAAMGQEHLPTGSKQGPVTLVAVTHVADVNALAPNETIKFGASGLTVVYGDNGAGKSGYARILKRGCRARGAKDPVLPNALSEQPGGTPTAKLTLAVDGKETEHLWKDGVAGPPELGAVSVFDESAAQVYVADKTEVRFRPFGLDILDKLASVCARVKELLESEKSKLQGQSVVWPDLPRDTEAARLIAGLTALTPRPQVDKIATLTDAERRERETLADVVATARADNPANKASDLRVKAGRLRRLAEEVAQLERLLGAEALGRVAALRSEAGHARVIADAAAAKLAGSAALPGLGSMQWRAMWDAARAYSDRVAYPRHSFPHVDAGAACLLCQREIDSAAKASLIAFENLVRAEAQTVHARKHKAAEEAAKACLAIVPGDRVRDALEDLAVLDGTVAQTAAAFLEQARLVCDELATADGAPKPLVASSLAADLTRLAVEAEGRAEEMAKAADPAGRRKAEARLAELQARQTLEGVRDKIHAEIDRRARINAYEICIKDTETRAITKVSTELTKKYVTDTLTTAFDVELKRLGFTTPELAIRPVGGQKGVLYHQVQLKHSTRAELPKVVSDGESRCIALAAFMAELKSAESGSAIVFDDPVSSLDHRWRVAVSKRLVEESATRQVIVFTHEMVFLAALLQEADRQDISCVPQTIRRGSDSLAGHVEEGLPWTGMSTQKRIGALKNEPQRLEKVLKERGQKDYEAGATRFYADLRRTWERAIEEVLLNDAVMRFRQGIETNRLKKIGDVCSDDLDKIEAGMTKSSKWEGGHDQALAVNEPLPAPAELKADFELLEQWVAAVKKRRQ